MLLCHNSVKLESNVINIIFGCKNSKFDRSSSAAYISSLRLWSTSVFSFFHFTRGSVKSIKNVNRSVVQVCYLKKFVTPKNWFITHLLQNSPLNLLNKSKSER